MQPGFSRADMHMHTNVSDGASDVRDLLAHIQQMNHLDVIAITDHDRLEASLWAYEHQDDYPFDIVPGMEVTSREGHVLAWWVTEHIPHRLSLEDTVQAIHEAGGIAVLAHPFHRHVGETRRGLKRYAKDLDLIHRAGFDAVEVINSGTIIPGVNWYARFACRNLPIAQVGNSDAHTTNAVASASTTFPGKTASDFRRAILDRKTRPAGGPWSPAAYLAYAKGVRNGTIKYVPVADHPHTARSS